MALLIDFSVIFILIFGIWLFRDPGKAKLGNIAAAVALLCALLMVMYRNGIIDYITVTLSLLTGSTAGYMMARAVNMIQIPSIVAFQNGAGGAAASLVSIVELMRNAQTLDLISTTSGITGLAVGSLTFSGSMVASAKLAGKISHSPHRVRFHDALVIINIVALPVIGAASFYVSASTLFYLYLTQILLAASLGILFSIRVGGADMPVLISFLNAMTGLAAALCGVVMGNRLLIAFGATVSASGTILTYLMCRAMNRSLFRVFLPAPHKEESVAQEEATAADQHDLKAVKIVESETGSATDICYTQPQLQEAVRSLMDARRVIIIPGYGMALAQAQFKVLELASLLIRRGATVKYAIHPVAGRMPGHMNVILAEAEIDYDDLLEIDDVNPMFANTDLVLCIGACDVVNPAAIQSRGTPISGMPILMAHEAKKIVVCNLDEKPGYSGVPNPLYRNEKTIMLSGDARASITDLICSIIKSTPA